MKILVCIKQVPDTADIKWTKNNTIDRSQMDGIINPFDEYALETALRIKDMLSDTKITALSMGTKQAEKSLLDALALGCDDAVLLSDKKFAGADTIATATTLSKAIQNCMKDFDLVVCGQFATDGDTAQTGPALAEKLRLPQVTYVKKIVDVNEHSIIVEKESEYGIETLQISLPALICMQKCSYELRQAKIKGYMYAQQHSIKTLTQEDLQISEDMVGLKGSPTYVSKAFRPDNDRKTIFLEGTVEEQANQLAKILGEINNNGQ